MSVQEMFNKAAIDAMPIVREIINSADDFERNQMYNSAIAQICDFTSSYGKCLADMTKNEIKRASLAMVKGFAISGWHDVLIFEYNDDFIVCSNYELSVVNSHGFTHELIIKSSIYSKNIVNNKLSKLIMMKFHNEELACSCYEVSNGYMDEHEFPFNADWINKIKGDAEVVENDLLVAYRIKLSKV